MENVNHHTGRGGAGNEHHAEKKDKPMKSLADDLKKKLFGMFKKGSS
jgi:hypothetical protein